MAWLRDRGAADIIVVGGGVIPEDDLPKLHDLGVREILLQDTPPDAIVAMIRRVCSPSGGHADGAVAMSRPRYDADYLPLGDSRYWSRSARQCLPLIREAAILARLKDVTRTRGTMRRSTAVNGTSRLSALGSQGHAGGRRATVRESVSSTMLFSGEPGASVPGVRDRIANAYGAHIIDCGSMAEMTPFMNLAGTDKTSGMLLWGKDVVYTEVCDARTFRRVAYCKRGTPVYTRLERTSQPMIRLISAGRLDTVGKRAKSVRSHVSAPAARCVWTIDDREVFRETNARLTR